MDLVVPSLKVSIKTFGKVVKFFLFKKLQRYFCP